MRFTPLTLAQPGQESGFSGASLEQGKYRHAGLGINSTFSLVPVAWAIDEEIQSVLLDYQTFRKVVEILLDYGLGKAMDDVAGELPVCIQLLGHTFSGWRYSGMSVAG